MDEAAFEVIAPSGPRAPIVAHIPHASTVVPPAVRGELLLSEAHLDVELVRLTDWYTDELFGGLSELGATLFVNRLSRLVYDPERFLDAEVEPAEAVGQGVVYWQTVDGRPLREKDPELRERRVQELYQPYHAALDALVVEMLAEFGQCTVIDCHSFPAEPMPTEVRADGQRPGVCVGTDRIHTPEALAAGLEASFRSSGFEVRRDVPFAGTFVPSGAYGQEPRVRSVMIEVRRDTYMDERTGERSATFGDVRTAIEAAVRTTLRSQASPGGG